MDHPRLIHDYLDGELPSERQSELFADLAVREDLRSELQAQLRLHLAVRKDHGATAVPVDATHGIFAELGLPSPITISPTLARPHETASSTRTIAFLVLLALAVLSTGTLMLNRYDTAFPSGMTTPSPNTSSASSTVATGATNGATTGATTGGVPPSVVVKRPVRNAQTPIDTQAVPREAPDAFLGVSSMSTLPYDEPITYDGPGPNDELPASALPSPPDTRSAAESTTRFETTLRSMAMRSTDPDPSLVSGASTLMPFAAGVSYDLGSGHWVGIDLGYESVPQVFTRVENGQTVEYRQDPNVFWIGGTYRYRARTLSIGGIATPFVSGTMAYTQLGPMARASTGFTITPETHLSILIGLEGMMLIYPVQSQFFSTRSLQLTYGISYRF